MRSLVRIQYCPPPLLTSASSWLALFFLARNPKRARIEPKGFGNHAPLSHGLQQFLSRRSQELRSFVSSIPQAGGGARTRGRRPAGITGEWRLGRIRCTGEQACPPAALCCPAPHSAPLRVCPGREAAQPSCHQDRRSAYRQTTRYSGSRRRLSVADRPSRYRHHLHLRLCPGQSDAGFSGAGCTLWCRAADRRSQPSQRCHRPNKRQTLPLNASLPCPHYPLGGRGSKERDEDKIGVSGLVWALCNRLAPATHPTQQASQAPSKLACSCS